MKLPPSLLRWGLALALVTVAGCKSAYYGAYEQFGVYKRDLLVDQVEDARDAQEDAKAEFRDALEQFASVVTVEESNLKSTYERLADALEDAEDRAEAVTNRIDAVEDVSEDLFDEWRDEVAQISNARLRSSSERQLRESEQRYETLIRAMRRAEGRMEPVLTAFRDHVLYLKHNLNAQAIASLRTELDSIEADVAVLIREMEEAIASAQGFIDTMDIDGGNP